MFAVIYISVALLQLSFGRDISEYDIPEEVAISSDYKEDNIIQNIQPKLENDGNVITTDDIPLSDENFENENIGVIIEPINSGGPATQGEVTITTPFECDENINESLDEDIATENDVISDEVVPNIITLSNPVKAGGKVTIIANFGCEDRKNIVTLQETDSKEVDDEVPDGPSFRGPVHAQGKVSIGTHYGCGGRKNIVTVQDTDSKEVDDEVPDGPSFRGPVHAQGKVSIGTHYGCGAPVGMPPLFPMPWFSTLSPIYHSSVQFPTYPIPGSYVVQYPSPLTETGASPVFNDPSSSEDSGEYLPVASTLANSINGSGEEHHGMSFNGLVPACGTVSIAARF